MKKNLNRHSILFQSLDSQDLVDVYRSPDVEDEPDVEEEDPQVFSFSDSSSVSVDVEYKLYYWYELCFVDFNGRHMFFQPTGMEILLEEVNMFD